MSQPLDINCRCEALGAVDKENGQFWVENPWLFQSAGQNFNLSCYERNRVYASALPQDGRFVEVSWLTGADDQGDSRGIVGADLDNDGMPDLVLAQIGGGALKIFQNHYPKASWLKVSLRGVRSNSLGIGARLTAEVGGRSLRRDLTASNTMWAQAPAQVLFGLGDAKKVDRLTIRWPSGEEQVLIDVAVNRHVEIREGDDHAVDFPAAAEPGK